MKRKREPLLGQKLLYCGMSEFRKNHLGHRGGRIVRVTRTRAGGISRIVIEDASGLPARPGREAIRAARVRLFPKEWTHRYCGIQRYKVVRPLAEVDTALSLKP